MRFLRRSLVGIFLFAVTLAVAGYAAQTVIGAVRTVMNEEERDLYVLRSLPGVSAGF